MCFIDCLIPYLDQIDRVFHSMLLPPESILLLSVIFFLISGFSAMINHALMDLDRIYDQNMQIKKYQYDRRLAKATANKELWMTVKKNEKHYLELQKSVMMSKMLPQLLTFGPLIFMYTTLRSRFDGPVALFPFRVPNILIKLGNINGLSAAGFGIWYFLTAICIGTVLFHIFGIDLTGRKKASHSYTG